MVEHHALHPRLERYKQDRRHSNKVVAPAKTLAKFREGFIFFDLRALPGR